MKIRTLFPLTLLTLSAGSLFAQEGPAAEEKEPGPWSGKVSIGFLSTSGNTDTSTLNSAFEVGYAAGKWSHLLDASAVSASEDDETTAEAYSAGWTSERNITEHDFLFGQLRYQNDRFSGVRTQFSQSVGYGRRLINTTAHTLNAQAGVGARQLERADGVKEDDIIVSGGLAYQWTFSETANFTQDLLVEYGEENTYLESVSAVRARLIGDLALVASYTIKNNSEVPADTDNTDTYTALSVEYTF